MAGALLQERGDSFGCPLSSFAPSPTTSCAYDNKSQTTRQEKALNVTDLATLRNYLVDFVTILCYNRRALAQIDKMEECGYC
jgi:hypothetical protein